MPLARHWLLWLAGLLAAWHVAAFGQTGAATAAGLIPVPALTDRVLDQTGTLAAQERQALVQKLAQLESTLGSQIVILMVPTTQPEDIAAFAFRVADQWKIGRKEVGDGVLVVVAKNDRRVRIEVARALEGAIPDLAAHQIIERAMTPAFKTGDFAGGLDAGVDQLAARIKGEALPLPDARATARPGPQWEDLGIFLFLGVPIAGAVLKGLLGRKLGTAATGLAAGALGWFWTSSLLVAGIAVLGALALAGAMGGGGGRGRGPGIGWAAGGWGGGSGGGWGGGGGFSSGGGGSFGGGGASGSW